MKFDFIAPGNARNNGNSADVTIVLCKNGQFSVTFRNSTHEKISKSGRVKIGLPFGAENRLYFVDDREGFKLTTGNTARPATNNRYILCKDNRLMSFVGDHTMLYDKNEKLYYIELK